jgi:hypothetical protein
VLRDLVQLEVKRGCHNDAAVGGFARLALSLVDTATAAKGGAAHDRLVGEARSLLVNYEFLEPPGRGERCSALLALLNSQNQQARHAPESEPELPQRHGRGSANMLIDTLEEPVSNLWGIGPRVQETLARLGIVTISDLLQHAPRR